MKGTPRDFGKDIGVRRYQVAVANLDKRTDRWLTCLGYLLGQGVPPNQIMRFSAFDAADYKNANDARAEALAMHDSPYLANYSTQQVGSFCCNWTFYTIFRSIASQEVGSLKMATLFIIDDMVMKYNFDEITFQLNMLSGLEVPFRMIQYSKPPITNVAYTHFDRPQLESMPDFQKGISSAGDWAILFTPRGAQDLLDLVDERRLDMHLCFCIWHFGNEMSQEGCYSTRENAVYHRTHPYVDNLQDRSGQRIGPKWEKEIELCGRFEVIR